MRGLGHTGLTPSSRKPIAGTYRLTTWTSGCGIRGGCVTYLLCGGTSEDDHSR